MAPRRPDILFVLTEQQRYDTIGALGYSFMETPVMDRLIEEGVTFTHAFIAVSSSNETTMIGIERAYTRSRR